MAMTPEQMAAFYQEQAEASPEFLAAARHNRDFHLLVLNQGVFVKGALISGMIRWRHRLGDPRPVFRLAVEGSAGFLTDASEVDASQTPWKHFSFELVDYVRVLLGEPVNGEFVAGCLGERLPDKHEFDDLHLGDRFLDMAVLLKLATGLRWRLWGDLLQRRAANRRAALVAETYRAYWDLLDSVEAGDAAQAAERAAWSATLYAKRKKDPYYAGGIEYEGGGPYNESVVDFRLAAIIRAARALAGLDVSLPPQFVHRWPY
jgi:hypothetical protein